MPDERQSTQTAVRQPHTKTNTKALVYLEPDTLPDKMHSILVNVTVAVPFSLEIKPCTSVIRILPFTENVRFGICESPEAEITFLVNVSQHISFDGNFNLGNVALAGCYEVRTLEEGAKRLYLLPEGPTNVRIEYA